MSNNNNLISFLQLKPNSNNHFNSICYEIILKLLNNDDLKLTSNDTEDLLSLVENDIIKHTCNEPITFINNFFKKQLNIKQSDDKEIGQLYNIMSYNSSNNKYDLLLSNKQFNSSQYITNLQDIDKQTYFNSLGSLLVKYYTNSEAIFGDVFLLSIDKKYYDILLKFGDIGDVCDEKQRKTLYDSLNRDLKQINIIYYDMTTFNYLVSFASISYVKIYEHTSKNFVYYSREYLDNFFPLVGGGGKNISTKTFLKNQIIKINYEKIELYIKYDKPLPGSHYSVINMINNSNSSTELQNEFHIVNISHSDILTI